MTWKRICSVALLIALVLMLAPAAFADGAGYQVTGTYNESKNTLTAVVSIKGTSALVGRFALGFDNTQLALPEKIVYISHAAKSGDSINLSLEGNALGDYISQERGHVLLAWYVDQTAVGDGATIATVTFTLKDGVTVDQLDSRSLYLYSVARNYQGWNTSAWLCGKDGAEYANCILGTPDCDVSFTYPGSDVPAADLREVRIGAADELGFLLPSATVTVDRYSVTTTSGEATLYLGDATYTCFVTSPGHETVTFWLTVKGSTYRLVQLRSLQRMLDAVADAIEIGYQGDDHAQQVTRDVYLPSTGAQGLEISWTSSDPVRLSPYGNVFRNEQAADVTLTATISRDGLTASKTFQLHITEETVPETPETPVAPVVPGEVSMEDVWEEEPETVAPFTDLGPVAAWAGTEIGEMYKLGIIKGTSETTFSPNDSITRADFLTLLMRMLAPECELGDGFVDVAEDAYYYEPILLAQGLGIASGVGDGRYQPLGSITRQDMIVLTYRALTAMGKTMAQAEDVSAADTYPDSDAIADYAREAMDAVLASGCIRGKGEILAPTATTTRAETAVFLYRVLQNISKEVAG